MNGWDKIEKTLTKIKTYNFTGGMVCWKKMGGLQTDVWFGV